MANYKDTSDKDSITFKGTLGHAQTFLSGCEPSVEALAVRAGATPAEKAKADLGAKLLADARRKNKKP